jgi:hypothetical protein
LSGACLRKRSTSYLMPKPPRPAVAPRSPRHRAFFRCFLRWGPRLCPPLHPHSARQSLVAPYDGRPRRSPQAAHPRLVRASQGRNVRPLAKGLGHQGPHLLRCRPARRYSSSPRRRRVIRQFQSIQAAPPQQYEYEPWICNQHYRCPIPKHSSRPTPAI